MSAFVVGHGSGQISRLPSHRNPGLEIVHVSHGHLHWHTEGKIEIVTPGSVFFTLPWQEHGSVDEFEPGHRWQYVILALDANHQKPRRRFGFHPGLSFTAPETRQIVKVLLSAHRSSFPAGDLLPGILKTLIAEKRNPGWLSETRLSLLAREAVLELCRQIRSGNPSRPPVRDRTRFALDRLIASLARQPESSPTLQEMASACGLKRSQFSDLFHRITGDSPVTFLNRMRVARARHLLKTTPQPVTFIAHECGFASSQYFSRQFRAFTGMDARTYRQRFKPLPPRS